MPYIIQISSPLQNFSFIDPVEAAVGRIGKLCVGNRLSFDIKGKFYFKIIRWVTVFFQI